MRRKTLVTALLVAGVMICVSGCDKDNAKDKNSATESQDSTESEQKSEEDKTAEEIVKALIGDDNVEVMSGVSSSYERYDGLSVDARKYKLCKGYDDIGALFHTAADQWFIFCSGYIDRRMEVIKENDKYIVGNEVESRNSYCAISCKILIQSDIPDEQNGDLIDAMNRANVLSDREFSLGEIRKLAEKAVENGEGEKDIYEMIYRELGITWENVEYARVKMVWDDATIKKGAEKLAHDNIIFSVTQKEKAGYPEESTQGDFCIKHRLLEEKGEYDLYGTDTIWYQIKSDLGDVIGNIYFVKDKEMYITDIMATGKIYSFVDVCKTGESTYSWNIIYKNEYADELKNCTVADFKADDTGFSYKYCNVLNASDWSSAKNDFGLKSGEKTEDELMSEIKAEVLQHNDNENVWDILVNTFGIDISFAEEI